MKTVTFHTTANGAIEFCAESAGNYWIIRLNPDGTKTLLRNLQPVDKLPASQLTRDLEKAASALADAGWLYQRAPTNDLYWSIRDRLAEL